MVVLEVAVLEDHLDLAAGLVGDVDDAADLVADVAPIAAEDFGNVDDHVQLLAAVGDGLFRFGDLDRGRVAAVREADRGAGHHGAAGEPFGTAFEVIGHDADARHVIGQGQGDPRFEVAGGQRRVEERVVDHLGDVAIAVRGGHRLGLLGGGDGRGIAEGITA